MGEGFIVRRGGGGQQTVKPIYNSLTEAGFTSLTLSVTNDSNSIATLYYSVVNNEPAPDQANTFDTEFAGKETKDITITGLTSGTTYTVYIKAIVIGEFPSETVIVPNLTTGSPIVATGGTITNYSSGGTDYRVHTFTSNGTFAVTSVPNLTGYNGINYLIVGGGGAGGNGMGAGGGAGGLVHNLNSSLFPITASNYTITIGAGASGTTSDIRVNGVNTTAFGITGLGGGGANSLQMQRRQGITTANTGGSGGGNGATDPGGFRAGAVATQPTSQWGGFGNNGGGSQGNQQNYPGGGGGGAGGVGATPPTGTSPGGVGGAGLQVNIDGNNYFWAGGGGGNGYTTNNAGNGGIGGGGGGSCETGRTPGVGGGSARNVGQNGVAVVGTANGGNGGANTGAGGGGAGWDAGRGGNGGSGIVIIRYVVGGNV
jgi:hypothetical protein